jgi:CYTH domain-containing protein
VATPKYARLEDEQRFVVGELPGSLAPPRLIEDRYVLGTRLRLRRVSDGDTAVNKLGHKVPVAPDAPSAVWHTTMYLDDAEYALLAGLPSATITKRRWTLHSGASGDEFLGELAGLLLVEGDRPVATPPGGVEVTDDSRFCGGTLATLSGPTAVAFVAMARELVT